MTNYKMTVSYDGSRFHGWQKQKNTENTVQGRLEEALGRIMGYPVELQGAGRTDRGVHAAGHWPLFVWKLPRTVKRSETA